MPTNRTFTMIKPDAVADGFTGPIIQQIEAAGFKIIALKKIQLSSEEAGKFYAVHAERPFFQSLCDYMCSGAIIPMVLEKENAVEDFRTLIGATNPAQAAEGTIRKQFARSLESNAIHGSDSDENAAIEGAFFFTEKELA
ncbi:nucleoside-diphosphate kinase [Aquirufa nivalisilvae]|jgi:nucleoside-diphosphate kinase|uniref:Nucleoside diphosphate kinase n=1 Tax=Aquirufa nivalisilvae TaxID=2516557 RepID=A0A2S2DUL3_9BACT|nr:nucleoside-diphosphate kinase [Aquirufa nivalisilvae]AWL08497.1 Nucleoside-diphosphate kinase [Aquirufa nivalisilvae]MCZ2478967.1 nucleoside-diphosphate kinase [Aquirufa nivalisilvae]MCZ2483366.1 nucleoside-diphosphate kinase [Aquirufa nivalisilvae]TBH75897.1 nucleoside-diphosphate kinase [Aquirufa nivalisilvae]